MSEFAKVATGAALGWVDSDPNLSKVREILYGAEFQEFDKRIADLSLRIATESDQLRGYIGARLDQIERMVLDEVRDVKQELHEIANQSQNDMLDDALRRINTVVDTQIGSVNRHLDERFLELAYRIHALDAQVQALTESEQHNDSHKLLDRILGEHDVRANSKFGNRHAKQPD